jgi:ribosome biogenesis protein BMS1
MEDQVNRPHRKAKEKKRRDGGQSRSSSVEERLFLLTAPKGPNLKAFAYANPGRLQKQAVRSHEVPGNPVYASSAKLADF